MYTQINNRPELKEIRKSLRNNSTSAEATLWLRLKKKKVMGYRFRRQFSVGYYILDFYCPKAKLAIELDGAHHYTDEGHSNDKHRDEHLQEMGITVLRFENNLIFNSLDNVIEEIKSYLPNEQL
jgi:very-short-patch-repair endonuclease